jgi:arylsulfatase A-like enzyme
MAMLMDLFPSFCTIAGADLNHEVDGVDLSPSLLGKPQDTDNRYVFWVRREGGQKYNGQSYYAARYGPYKMLQNSAFEPYQYYNLKEDPLEQDPLGPEDYSDFARLREELQSHIQKSGRIPWQNR